MVYGLFPTIYRHGYPPQVEEHSDNCIQRQSTSSWLHGKPQHSLQPDIFKLFWNMGLKVFSNLLIKMPTQCSQQADRKLTKRVSSMEDRGITKEQPQFTTQGRYQNSLPETWIWNLFFIGEMGQIYLCKCSLPLSSNGSRSVPVMAPDAVTKWKVNMFCLARRTFGLAPTISFRTVQPVFVDVTLPYSVIQGETFMLKAIVFNYLQQCLQIHMALDKLLDFQVEDCQTCRDRECLCVDESKTFTWNVTATQLGVASKMGSGDIRNKLCSIYLLGTLNITIRTEILDTTSRCGGRKPLPATMRWRHALMKHLLVRPEGVLVEKSYSSLLCPRQGNMAEEPLLLHLPDSVVKGFASASVSISGDIMGLALQNLDRQVQMPHGCGEQNMVLFTPIVYVLQYLEKTRQLTPVIKERATGFLRNGKYHRSTNVPHVQCYQTQLLYRHRDGSYSVFGRQDGEGNTWLTAFVAKSFAQAKKYIYVDDKNIQDALRWLEQNQLPSGCFAIKGNLFHSSMKGSLDDEISLGAYVAAALLELGQPLKGKLMQATFRCLQHAVHNITNMYTEAVLAYAFALAGDYETTQELLYKLEEQAIKSADSDNKVNDNVTVKILSFAHLQVLTFSHLSYLAKLFTSCLILSSLTKVFHTLGSLDDEISLGAYVAAALLELGQPLKGKLMQATFRCLQHAVHNITNMYTEAVLAYAFALAGDYETTQELLYKLEEQAIKSGADYSLYATFPSAGGQIHWSSKPSSPAPTDFWHSTQSVDVELTAYVLLAYLSKPRLHARDMKTAAGIVVWLTQQQNANGGFASTQDTVVALQALAKYAEKTFSTSGQTLVRVRVKSQRDFGKTFQVTRQKRLLMQHAELTEIPGQFLMQVHGRSCVFAQTVLRYHEPTPQTTKAFSLRLNTELANCGQANTHGLTVRILAR
ncbi:UNVERIFIED_CONTAM: hypothetical protein H355_013409 [Colinus virginianus]|nr:hypothetical protein H355_013409 [Colinus virginianus]